MTHPRILRVLPQELRDAGTDLDSSDDLAGYRTRFIGSKDVIAYLDGNSLDRPPAVTRDRLRHVVDVAWGNRLIRAWNEEWMDAPVSLGDLVGRVVLGAASGATSAARVTPRVLRPEAANRAQERGMH
jgi:kynureninase